MGHFMRKRRLVLFKGELDTVNLFTEQLKQGFLTRGDYEILEFNLCDAMKSLGELYAFFKEGQVTAMLGFNSMFFGTKLPSGVSLCEALEVPCINILLDHPYWYTDILKNMPLNGIVLCVDRGHMDYVNRFYPKISVNGFIPHGGTVMSGRPKSIMERGIDVFYAGSLYAEYADKQKPDFSKWDFPAEMICEETIQKLFRNPAGVIEDVLEETLREHGITMSDEELGLFISSCVYIERVVSSYFREKILRVIARAGIRLELYGAGWEKCDWLSLPNVYYGGRISPEAVLEKMEDSKIVLNSMPWFKDGSHERIINGMLRGAVVCSDTSRYLEEILPRDAWMTFGLEEEELADLPRRVKAILNDVEAMQRIADAGYALARKKHTWQARALELHEDLLSLL